MSKRDDVLLVDDMLSSFKAIEEYTKGMSYDEFINNKMCIDAVIRNFEIIGEAANYVSNDFKDKHRKLFGEKWLTLEID